MTNKPNNIVLLVIDSLRYDRLSCYGYDKPTSPFLDSIAEEGLQIPRGYSTAPWTVPVHGSLFSGQLPSHHGTHRKSKSFKKSEEDSLAGVLSKSGYKTGGFSANPWLSSEFSFDTGFNHYEYLSGIPPFDDEPTAPKSEISNLCSFDGVQKTLKWATQGSFFKRIANGFWKRFLDSGADVEQINNAIIEWVSRNNKEQKFIFANYMDVHDPHLDDILGLSDLSLPSSDTRANIKTRTNLTPFSKEIDFMSEPHSPERAEELYDRAIRRTDEGLRQLFEELEEALDLDETLVVILGDHGECLGDNGYWGHGTYLYEELIRIPMIVLPPDSVARPDETHPMSLLDLVDYITTVAGTELNATTDLPSRSFSENQPMFAETTAPRPNMKNIASVDGYEVVIKDNKKLIRNRTTDENQMMTVYQDKNNPETTYDELRMLLQKQWSGVKNQDEIEDRDEISDQMKSRLSDLGYL